MNSYRVQSHLQTQVREVYAACETSSKEEYDVQKRIRFCRTINQANLGHLLLPVRGAEGDEKITHEKIGAN